VGLILHQDIAAASPVKAAHAMASCVAREQRRSTAVGSGVRAVATTDATKCPFTQLRFRPNCRPV